MAKTITEEAKELRATLKEMGFNSRQVSVKSGYCGYSTSMDVTIKARGISVPQVEELANKYKSVRHDEMTGEILSGGNTYVTVGYKRELLEEIGEDYREAVTEWWNSNKDTDYGVEVFRLNDKAVTLWGRRSNDYHQYQVSHNGKWYYAGGIDSLCEALAKLELEQGLTIDCKVER